MKEKRTEHDRLEVLPCLLRALCASWLLTSFFFGSPAKIAQVGHSAAVPLMAYLLVFLLGGAALFLLGRGQPRSLRLILACSCLGSMLLWAAWGEDDWLTLGLGALTLGGLLLFREELPQFRLDGKGLRGWYWLCGILLAAFIGAVTVGRYLTFRAPGFDFGIFSQMFAYMRKTGIPYTTCERSRLLSHLNVHFSPIYYLMLPLYWLFPSPVTLQVEQALVVAAGLWPLYLLCRQQRLSNGASGLLAVAYLLFPALSGGCFYDLHENCFLTVCLLFVFYGAEAGKWGAFWGTAALTLCVKEDAGIYLAFLGLYYFLSGRRQKQGAALFGVAVAVFCVTTGYVTAHGDGVISSRFANLVPDQGDGMLAVVRTALTHPGYLLRECFTAEKAQYMLFMLLPWGPLLLCKKEPAQYLLLGPMVLLNILPDYKYQYTIDFQYNFGNTALLMYFAVLRLARMDEKKQVRNTLTAAVVCAVLFCGTNLGRLWYAGNYLEQPERYRQMEEALAGIPADASVSASSGLIAHLAEHDILYPAEAKIATDYLALDLRWEVERGLTEGYTLVTQTKDIGIYIREIPER